MRSIKIIEINPRFGGATTVSSKDGLDNLIEAEFLPKEIESKFTFNIPKYWYLIHRCNILKNKQEVKKNFKYDCVIVTRPDVLYDKNLLDDLSHKLDELCVYSSEINYSEDFYGLGTMDVSAYGTSSTMDIFSSLYKHTFMSDDFNMIPNRFKHDANIIGK